MEGMGLGEGCPLCSARETEEQLVYPPRSPDRCCQGVENVMTTDSAWVMVK